MLDRVKNSCVFAAAIIDEEKVYMGLMVVDNLIKHFTSTNYV
jgi:hypothetical protein